MSDQIREEWIDRLKGILISLVVLGHVVGSVSKTCTPAAVPFFESVYKAIYFFHMPAFFVVAGLLWKMPRESFAAFAQRKMMRLLVPFWLFGLVSMLIYWIFAARLVGESDYWAHTLSGSVWWSPLFALATGSIFPGTDGFRCNSVLWFLPCLFVLQMVYFFVSRLPQAKLLKLCLAIACLPLYHFLVAHLSYLPCQLNMVVRYFPFMVAGECLTSWSRQVKVKWFWALVVLGAYLVVAYLTPNDWRSFHLTSVWLITVILAFGGSLLALLVAKCLSGRLFVFLGTMSIGIMVLHKFAILAIQMLMPGTKKLLYLGGCGALSGGVVIFLLALGMSVVASRVILKFAPWTLGMKR